MALPRTVKAVVFDMDGLLVDSEVAYCEALTAEALAMGFELPMAVLKRMIGSTWAGSAAVLRDHFGADFDTDGLRDGSVKRFYELAEAEIALKAGVLELLDHLDAAGLPRAIATSSRHTDVRHHLTTHALAERFNTVVAQGDYARGKPHPDPYLTAAERLGVDPAACLALEDSHNGVRAAHAAGMMTIMVPDMLDPTEEMHTLCVRIARDLHEVRELLEGQHQGG
jgi:HAD superfamily hydrolase (TIGR01509 family)